MSPQLSTWDTGTRKGLFSIGTHSLYLTGAGPYRETINGRRQPAVIIEAGLSSGHLEWVAVSRLISERARVYTYDRAGYGRSEPSPSKELTAQNRVEDLHQLLYMAGIEPPYVLVGHSYGGVLVREFLRQHREEVAGMVIAIVGLEENHVMSPEEYAEINADEEHNMPTTKVELDSILESTELVNRELPEGAQVMGDNRLSVIFANESIDFGKIYDYAVKHGTGTEEARERLRSRFVYAQGKAKTHNLQYVAPEVIRDEVFWVLGLTD
ncbi:alpha/beta-hydrolase [Aspergillus ellipticus CBS 707.79]|uniref:Alpha/beta-hydrolase n=1 Tax=Aspergillus ellipticus CBS 707.79 TaxID=1448320 RepID=A0A319ENQ2_9EURO|nr:alpha/beta-hydrolase [Aspergillus ellipticus CBS 707.79]